jgi:hypothetical protein
VTIPVQLKVRAEKRESLQSQSSCDTRPYQKSMLILNTLAVAFMCGLHWFVQIVHYPLFSAVGQSNFRDYHSEHSTRTTYVVIVPMMVDIASSAWLVIAQPDAVGFALPMIGLVLALVTWISTGLLQVPRHDELSAGFNETSHRRLVASSWVRTISWTAHAGVCAAMLAAVS